jgi:hypothetical protein
MARGNITCVNCRALPCDANFAARKNIIEELAFLRLCTWKH